MNRRRVVKKREVSERGPGAPVNGTGKRSFLEFLQQRKLLTVNRMSLEDFQFRRITQQGIVKGMWDALPSSPVVVSVWSGNVTAITAKFQNGKLFSGYDLIRRSPKCRQERGS